jgi:electron transport complex protein RnfC
MLEETDRVVLGLDVILRMFPDAKGVIAIEDNKKEAIKAMEEAVKDYKRISVATLKTKYPQGAEKMLIYSVTKREVPSGGLPADVGCIVQNIDTVVAIHRAIYRGRPLMRRIVTVSGSVVKNPRNFKVRIGTSYKEIIEAAGGYKEEPAKVISGGPMMGIALFSLDVPVIKGSSSILSLTKEESEVKDEGNCIRCGKCSDVCPMRLMPSKLNKLSLHGNLEGFVKNHGMDCAECGSCVFICPANRHLLQSIRTAKKTIAANRKKK